MPSVSSAMLNTIIYADLFDYPLTEKEVWKRLIRYPGISQLQIHKILPKIKSIQEKNDFYFLKRREKIVEIRQRRKKYSEEKLKIAQKAVGFLKYIPTIKLIGISGALAINNADKNDDIDFFIISSVDSLWTTRFFVVMILDLLRLRRRKGEKNIKDKICLNMFVDEKHLAIPKEERDLFSAHEVVQLKPLYDRGGFYNKFLKANDWVKDYLPNAFEENTRMSEYKKINKVNRGGFDILRLHCFDNLSILEKICKFSQLWYLKKHRTKEVIKDGFVRFHPHDARKWILEKYSSKITT